MSSVELMAVLPTPANTYSGASDSFDADADSGDGESFAEIAERVVAATAEELTRPAIEPAVEDTADDNVVEQGIYAFGQFTTMTSFEAVADKPQVSLEVETRPVPLEMPPVEPSAEEVSFLEPPAEPQALKEPQSSVGSEPNEAQETPLTAERPTPEVPRAEAPTNDKPARAMDTSQVVTTQTSTPVPTVPSVPSTPVATPETFDSAMTRASMAETPVAQQLAAVIKPVRLQVDGSHRISIELHPAELGSVQVEVSLRDGTISIRAVAEHLLGRDALQAALPELRAELTKAGVHLGNVDVGDKTANGGQSQAGEDRSGEGRKTATVAAPQEARVIGREPIRVGPGALSMDL